MLYKYLSESLTGDEAKKAYRTLAKTMHPDVGGDEEEFKVLANELTRLLVKANQLPIANVEDLMEAAGAMVAVITQTLCELYPRTRVVLNYTLSAIDVEVVGNVPMSKMLHIEQVIKSFEYPLAVTLYFQRNGIKKWIALRTFGYVTCINMEQGVIPEIQGIVPEYSGTRYTMYKTRYYEQGIDKRMHHTYLMRRMAKLTLKELLGI